MPEAVGWRWAVVVFMSVFLMSSSWDLEIALSGASAKVKPPNRLFGPGRKCVETSDDVIEKILPALQTAVYGTLVLWV